MQDGAWVDSLCPADLVHYHDEFAKRRMSLVQAERRFAVASAVAAAKVPHDSGKAATELFKALGGDTETGAPAKKQTFGAALAAKRGQGGAA